MKAWLKGGLILAGLYIILNILMFIFGLLIGGEGLLLFIMTSSFPIVFMFHGLMPEPGTYFLLYCILNMVIQSVILFGIGALIGGIIGSKKK